MKVVPPIDLSCLLNLVALLTLLPSAGCATFTHGTDQMVPVTSTPDQAQVIADGAFFQTPCVLRLARARDHSVTVTKPGYEPATVPITRCPTDAVQGNIWIGGLVGWGVDSITGANSKLVPESVHIHLAPVFAESQRHSDGHTLVSHTE